jgi:nicotinate-nucleotide adenylyltransferase
MRIGICGGTFDPFHRGHLEPIMAVRETMQWDRVLYVPAYRQPFKSGETFASIFHRFAMAVLATDARDGIWVSPIELERAQTSYTVDTLGALTVEYPGATLEWIIGDDHLPGLEGWRNLPRILELANFALLTRDAGSSALGGPAGLPLLDDTVSRPTHGAIVRTRSPAVPVSATEIRNRVRAGESIDGFVDPRVSRYIQHNRLYRERAIRERK